MKLPCAVVLLFLLLMASGKGYGFEDHQENSYQQVEAISDPTCAPSEGGLSSEEQEIMIRLERGDITVEELLERNASRPIIPKLRCEDGPQKLTYSIPDEFHWPPIMKGSCDNLPGCRVPPCFPQRTVHRSVCVLVSRFINGQWVRIGYQIRSFLDHLSCECKQCKHIRSQRECVNTYACPNNDNECTFCYWNNTLPIGKRQVPDAEIPSPFGRCGCCTPYCCPAPKRFNYDRCRCDCPNIILCPTGQIFNHDTCKCECPRISCPPGQVLNPKTCKCECTRVILCPPEQIFNHDTCKCECPRISCPPGQVLNPKTCKCECTRVILCPPEQIFNHDTCKCECPRISCPPGQILNPKTCKCECARVILCPPGQIFNQKTCLCECARFIHCPPGQLFNRRTCKCECPEIIRCPPGQIFNPKTCKCECPKGSKMDDSGRCIGECHEIEPAFCTSVFCEENPRLRCRQIDFQCRCA